jgi:hypothetical protein
VRFAENLNRRESGETKKVTKSEKSPVVGRAGTKIRDFETVPKQQTCYMQRVLSALVDHESTVERGALWSAAFTAGPERQADKLRVRFRAL